jgi:hypothetical protein
MGKTVHLRFLELIGTCITPEKSFLEADLTRKTGDTIQADVIPETGDVS